MGKNNGPNNIPGWVKRDLQMLKRVSVSLVEVQLEMRQDTVEMRRQHAEDIAEMRRRTDTLVEQTADLKRLSNIHSTAILKLLKKI